MELLQIGYYRLIVGEGDLKGRDGELFYLLEVHDDDVQVLQGESYWTCSIDDFLEQFEYVPDGEAERARQMAEAMTELHQAGSEQDVLIAQTSHTPAIEYHDDQSDDTPTTETPSSDVSTALSTIGGRNPETLKHSLKEVKTNVAKVKSSIKKRQESLKLFIREQEIIMREKAAALSKQIKKAEGAIDVINSYLGTGEEIVRLKKGKPAPAEEPITLRQLVLYMDEETAAAENFAEQGGIDFENVREFDKWIKKKDNLAQCLPEKKGIVAFKIRRSRKNYNTDPWSQNARDEANKTLYVLIRNGTNLYRIYTNLCLGGTLFPKQNEWEAYFYDHTFKRQDEDPRPLRPGSRQYMEAMEAAEENQRQYYKVLFMIQGMLDRTKVFWPLPEPRVNVCNLEHYNKYLQFVADAEMALGDGRPSFSQWLKDANGQLDKGSRVIGTFRSYYSQESGIRGRIHPKNAYLPDSLKLYTIEDKQDDALIIRWKREGEVVYTDWYRDSHEPKRRARMKLYRSDGFILNVDAVTVEEMRYYISSRIHRHSYRNMIPLMRTAIEIKQKEAEQEAPFRQMLIGVIAERCEVTHERAEDSVDELIHWWKFKNLTHRALICGEDTKAIRMIVDEFNKRLALEKQEQEKREIHNEVVELIRDGSKDILAIFHHRDNLYVVLRWISESNNVFVHEERWRIRASDCELVRDEERKNRVVDKRHQSWLKLYSHDRFDDWQINARPNEHLTPENEAEVVRQLLHQVRNQPTTGRRGKKKENLWLMPVLIIREDKETYLCYYMKYHNRMPNKDRMLTSHCSFPVVRYKRATWKKSRSGIEVSVGGDLHPSFFGNEHSAKLPWEKGYAKECWLRNRSEEVSDRNCLWRDDNAHLQARAEVDAIVEARKKRAEMSVPCNRVREQISDLLHSNWIESQRREYLEQYTDLDLFDEWIKERRSPHCHYGAISTAAGYVVERGESIGGMTLKQMFDKASKYGYALDQDEIEKEAWKEMMDVVLDDTYKMNVDFEEEWEEED